MGYPFKVEEQYLKNMGKPVEVKLKDNTKIQGTLKSYDGQTVTITYEEKQKVEGKKKKELVTIEKNIDLNEIKEIYETIIF
ncbi:MAG: hypothetical protein LIO65_02525 [Odoribacter sp.]|nr:hypothetical protein [Odoribacter sp.]